MVCFAEKHVCCDAALIARVACGKESQCVGRYHNNSLYYTNGGNLFSQYGKLHLTLEHVNVAQHLHVTPISLLLPCARRCLLQAGNQPSTKPRRLRWALYSCAREVEGRVGGDCQKNLEFYEKRAHSSSKTHLSRIPAAGPEPSE